MGRRAGKCRSSVCQMEGGDVAVGSIRPPLREPRASWSTSCVHEGLSSSRNCCFLCCVPGFLEGDREWDWGSKEVGRLPSDRDLESGRTSCEKRALRKSPSRCSAPGASPSWRPVLSTSEASLARQMEGEPSHWGGQDAWVVVTLTQARLSVPRAGSNSGTFLDREGAGP